ncbi:hypothetical protein [Ruminococcus sp.]|uniref:hypothetical protein n=1 Tax=Ruminococcus sp. TaxID=41978 RepID=UPI0025827555|nr:hypothetical protein [Ruminococcus sp.]MEE3439802.1 hypothetical protein [Ruminococcus sp.]
MNNVKNNQQIGKYLEKLISENFESRRKFCIKVLDVQFNAKPSEEQIANYSNKISQIIKGRKGIQIADLPIYANLLNVSCDEILSCGEKYIPIKNHMTNYQLAFSTDKKVWEKYINVEDSISLNYDEYGKSLIDYAFQFKNYDLVKYLISIDYINITPEKYFSDNVNKGALWVAETSVKQNNKNYVYNPYVYERQTERNLRTNLIILAIKNKDYKMIERLHAREIPELYGMDYTCPIPYGDIIKNYQSYQTETSCIDELIETIANSDENMIDYFSSEFNVQSKHNRTNTVMCPYLDKIVEKMLLLNIREVELPIRRITQHNKKMYEKLVKLLDEAHISMCKFGGVEPTQKEYRKICKDIVIDKNYNLIAFYNEKKKGILTDIFRINENSSSPLLRELIKDSNEWYDKIINLAGKED